MTEFQGPCPHPHVEDVLTGGGERIAIRCIRCLLVETPRFCGQCKAQLQIGLSAQQIYCRNKCRWRAARLRAKAQKTEAAA